MSDFGMQQVNHAWSGYFAWVSGWRRCRRPCKTLESQMGKLLVARAAATAFGRDEFSLLDAPGNIALRFLSISGPTARGLMAHEHGHRLELLRRPSPGLHSRLIKRP